MKRHGKKAGILFILLFAAITVFLICSSSFVSVRSVRIVSDRIPPSFTGTVILFAADIDCGFPFSAAAAADVIASAAGKSDMLILGGDYSGFADDDHSQAHRFITLIGRSEFPMGIYAVTGDGDSEDPSAGSLMENNGITCLDNGYRVLEHDDGSLLLAGYGRAGDYPLIAEDPASDREDEAYVIACVYHPGAVPAYLSETSFTHGLILSGGTHGGQVRLFGKSLFPLKDGVNDFEPGIRQDQGIVRILSRGLGCDTLPFRIGSVPELYQITLISE